MVLALAICTGTLQAAATIAASPTSITLHCDVGVGPTAAPIGITLLSAGAAENVTASSSSAAVVLPNPATLSVASTSVATSFSFTMASACAGATNNQQVTLTFTPAGGTALTVTATLAVTQPTIAASQSTMTLNCDTVLGPAPAVSIGITQVTSGAAIPINVAAPAGLTGANGPLVIPTTTGSINSTTVAIPFTFQLAPGCKNFIPAGIQGSTPTPTSVAITFIPTAGTGGVTVTATLVVTNSASALAPSPSAVTITCTKSGASYTNLTSQTVNVTSAANLGTPFTVATTRSDYPAWLSVSAGGTASTTAVALTVQPIAGCGGLGVGSTVYQVHLLNAPAPDKIFTVTIQIGATSTLVPNPTSISLSYQTTTGTPVYTSHSSTIGETSPAVFFQVDQTTIPVWLTVGTLTGTTSAPVPISFTPNAAVQTLALGNYSAGVHLKVSGQLDCVIPVALQVENPASSLAAAEGNAQSKNWTIGTALPTFLITPVSTDSPIAYTVAQGSATGTPLNPMTLSASQGVAYSFGSSPITVSFSQSTFGAVTPSTASLTGSVVFTYGSGSTYTVNLTVVIKSPGASISALSPSTVPTATTGGFTVSIGGSGFVTGSSLIATNAGLVVNGLIISDVNVVPTVIDSTSIVLAFTVPAAGTDPYLTLSSAGSLIIGVCNPGGATCSTPTSTATLTIGINPIVQAVTSASSYAEMAAPALLTVAPYDILSIFGTNFCISSGTGCTGSSATLYGTMDPVTLRFLATLSPDGGVRNLSVAFQTHTSSPVLIGNAPLLFASNNQINLLAPDALKAYIGNAVDIVVSFGALHGSPFTVNVGHTDPGIFTLSGDGVGDAAAETSTYAIIGESNPAVMMSTAADAPQITLYVTGLGRPDSTTGTAIAQYGVTCMATDDYWANVNAGSGVAVPLTSNDGLVLQSAYFDAANIQPCVTPSGTDAPTVTIGNVAGTVKYAGWVSGAIAGLYQINVLLPASTGSFVDAAGDAGQPVLATPLHLPVVVTANSRTSQPSGVNLWVQRGLNVTYTGLLTGTHSQAWADQAITVADGGGTYSYALTSGTLPDGIVLNASTGALHAATGLAADAVSETVTITVTDTSSTSSAGITGAVTIAFTIG